MKKLLSIFFITFLMCMNCVQVYAVVVVDAYDISVKNADGVTIYYNYINDGKELEVTHQYKDSYGYAVSHYSNSVVIPEEVTYMNRTRKVTKIGENAFVNCSGLTSVSIPNSVTSIGDRAFMYCRDLTSIEIPNSVTSIGESAFNECSGLTSITIPNSVTSIGWSAFNECSGLTSVTIPNSVTSIGWSTFAGCRGLTSITIPNSVWIIYGSAFKGCSGLTSITIPNSVTSIGDRAFYGCNLPEVISKIEDPFTINTNTFSDNTFYNATLYVPKGTIDKYKTTEGWERFAFIEEEIAEGENESINYPVSKAGINLYASDYSQVSFSTIFINSNSREVNCIRFGKSYKYTDNEYFYARLSVAGGFKAGDVIEIAGAYNNQDTKNSAISFRIDPTSSSPIWTTDNFINGRYSSEEPQIQTYTLTTDADALYFGRSGNTGTGITYLKVTRNQEVLPTGIEINDKNFPDPNFRKYLLKQDYGKDGVITDEEIGGVTEIDVSNQFGIEDLKGVEFFTALKRLNCNNSQMTSLDVSKNTALEVLRCSTTNRQLVSLDVSNNTALQELWLSYNSLTSLDVSKNTALRFLWVDNNQLSEIDLSNNTELVNVNCWHNNLTSLDVSNNTKLVMLACYQNQLKSLDVSNNTALNSLICSGNKIDQLDVSKNTMLEDLRCDMNNISSLDVSKNTMLNWLECYMNNISSLDVSKNTMLKHLNCSWNQLNALDVSKNTLLSELRCHKNYIKDTNMDILVESLPTGNGYTLAVFFFENEGNVMTTVQVAAAKAKGWIPMCHNGTDWKEYAGSEPERLSYTLTYVVDGETYKTYSIKEGEAITPEPEPTKEGYTFSGWDEIPATMPAHDVTVTGRFSVNKYKLTYMVDGEIYMTLNYNYGATITPEPAPTKEGYTFSGWSKIPATMPAYDVTVRGSFVVNQYTITYIIDNEVYTTQRADYGSTIIPPTAPEREGYDFAWGDYPETMPAYDITIYGTYTTGIEAIMVNEVNCKIFSLDGKPLNGPQKGVNIVRMTNGQVRKVVVK